MRPLERALRITAQTHGVITRQQLVDCGLTPGQIRALMASGTFVKDGLAVYRAQSAPRTYEQRVAVALGLAGPEAAASHGCAARLAHLGIPGFNRAGVEITVPHRFNRQNPRRVATLHRSRSLGPRDVTTIGSLRVTTPLRTAVDCALAPGVTLDSYRALVDDVLYRHGTPDGLRAAWLRSGRRTGRDWLEDALAPYTGGPAAESPKEMSLARVCWLGGLPLPDRQVKVIEPRSHAVIGRCDLAYRDARVGLEYLGRRFHAPRHERADAARHDQFDAIGWRLHYADKSHLVEPGCRLCVRELATDLVDRLPESHPTRLAAQKVLA